VQPNVTAVFLKAGCQNNSVDAQKKAEHILHTVKCIYNYVRCVTYLSIYQVSMVY